MTELGLILHDIKCKYFVDTREIAKKIGMSYLHLYNLERGTMDIPKDFVSNLFNNFKLHSVTKRKIINIVNKQMNKEGWN